MPYCQFLDWQEFFKRRPPEWRADARHAAMMMAWGDKRKPEEIMPSLEPIQKEAKKHSGASVSDLRANGFFMGLIAKGREKNPDFMSFVTEGDEEDY